jgi:L-ascorbate metabolism protein UlaG (beta-lactamase superfamily)
MAQKKVATSDHFDGRRFCNPEPTEVRGYRDLLRWWLHRESGAWRDLADAQPGQPPPRRVMDERLRVTFVNHSTVLIQMNGTNVLTDPIWSMRASPFSWAGPRRRRPPGIHFEDLPQIDVVLLSHDHYDHLDVPTLRSLVEKWNPLVIAPRGNGLYLGSQEIPWVQECDWWDSREMSGGLRVTCVPARHFSGRRLRDRNRRLWCGYVVQGIAGGVYFAGDTGYGKHFEEIAARVGRIRLALLPIGAFRPRWFMAPVHLSPEEALRAHQVLGALTSVAIHFGTFRLADDGQDEPAAELHRALDRAGEPRPRFWVLEFGEGRDVP